MVRGVTELSGLREIRTMHSSRKRSIPHVQSSAYLDLYMLRKEKERIEKEVYILEKRRKGMQKRLVEIDAEMEKLEEQEASTRMGKIQGYRKPPSKEWRSIRLNY